MLRLILLITISELVETIRYFCGLSFTEREQNITTRQSWKPFKFITTRTQASLIGNVLFMSAISCQINPLLNGLHEFQP